MADDKFKNEGTEKSKGAGAGANTGGQYQQEEAGRNPQDRENMSKERGGPGGTGKPEESRGAHGGSQEGSRAGSQMGGQQGGQQDQGRRGD